MTNPPDDLETAINTAKNRTEKIGRPDAENLEAVSGILPLRTKVLTKAAADLKAVGTELTPSELFALASTDMFVEKAQLALTRRSDRLYRAGTISITATFGILISAAIFLFIQISRPIDSKISNNELILRVFQATALSAYVLVAVKYLVALARSFFHESSSLRERRHALRFGRMYVYLQKGRVSLEELQGAFQWNKESTTSFLDMNPGEIAETLLHRIVEALRKTPTETVKVLAEAWAKRQSL